MPLTPRYSWKEDDGSLALQITLPGTALRSVSLYISDVVIKVNAAPYVLVLDLFDAVDESSAVVKRVAATHILHIALQKQHARRWDCLLLQDSKAALKARREASMERKSQAETELAEKRKQRKHDEEKQTLRAQMAVDDMNRQILSDLKADEKQREEWAMYESFKELQLKQQQQLQQQEKQRSQSAQASVSTPSTSMPTGSSTNNQVEHAQNVATNESKTVASQLKPILKPILKSASGSTSASSTTSGAGEKRERTVSFASDVQQGDNQGSTGDEEEPILELNGDGVFDIATAPKKSQPPNLFKTRGSERDTTTSNASDMNAMGVTAEMHKDTVVDEGDGFRSATENDPVSSTRAVKLPPPRAAATAEIKFTPRVFPTPSRESKAAEEEDWLLKNRKHLKKHKRLHGAAADYDISETDPMWLKAKGDDFYRSRDYRSAMNAYSEALSLAPDNENDLLIVCLSNRAACHLQLANFEQCIADCSHAFSFLPDTPEQCTSENVHVVKQFRAKLKLLVRRGTALCRTGHYTEAKADYGVALTMDAQNPSLQHDYYQLLQLERADQAKVKGDELFKCNQLNDAIQEYTSSLALHPHSVACLSNRAASFLRLHDHQRCIDDCTRALELLQQEPGTSEQTESASGIAFFAVGPAAGTVKRRAWVIKTVVRRGTAYAAMGLHDKAKHDYSMAVELDPTNESLRHDLERIRDKLNISPPNCQSQLNKQEAVQVAANMATSNSAAP